MIIDAKEESSEFLVTFNSYDEIEAIGVGWLIYEHFRPDIEVSAYLGALAYEGNDLWSKPSTFSLNTNRGIENSLIQGIAWVAKKREEISTELFIKDAVEMGISKSFEQLEEISLGDHLDTLSSLAEELETAGVIKQNLE